MGATRKQLPGLVTIGTEPSKDVTCASPLPRPDSGLHVRRRE